jgi:hypothetical protein
MEKPPINRLFCIGPFNSGTNLLNNILNNACCVDRVNKKNIEILEAVIINEEPDPILKEISFKHVFSEEILNKYINYKNIGIIVLYKNVYNWIYSVKKSPYHLVFDTLFTTIDFKGNKFDNIIELYNFYYKMYINVIEKNDNVIFIDYYKLINDKISFNYINYKLSKFGLCIVSKLKLLKELNTPSKNHGDCVNNSKTALDNYLKNQQLVKKFIITNTNLIEKVDTSIINFFENKI